MTKHRRIDGQSFSLYNSCPTKKRANQIANKQRRAGYCVRVIRERPPGWRLKPVWKKKRYSIYRGRMRRR